MSAGPDPLRRLEDDITAAHQTRRALRSLQCLVLPAAKADQGRLELVDREDLAALLGLLHADLDQRLTSLDAVACDLHGFENVARNVLDQFGKKRP